MDAELDFFWVYKYDVVVLISSKSVQHFIVLCLALWQKQKYMSKAAIRNWKMCAVTHSIQLHLARQMFEDNRGET